MRFFPLLLTCLACGEAGPEAPDSAQVATEPALRFVASDNGLQRVFLVGLDGAVEWSVEVPSQPRDLTRIDDEVLVSVNNGAVRLSLADGSTTWAVDRYDFIQSAQPTAAGGVLLAAQAGDNVVLTELDASGAELATTNLGPWPDLRLLRRTSSGTALFTTSTPDYRIVEVGMDGAELASIPLPGKGYVAEPTEDGTVLATTGGDKRLVELDADGTIVRAWGGAEDHPDLGLDWASGFQRIEGGAVVTNWLGHGMWGTAPHVVWFNANNELLYQWEDHDAALQVTNVVVLEHTGLTR